ncbi:MAG TPA: cell division protein ZipA C-terminal FtsZ-binding domain-containing protein [Gallionellaceae bacterium]
MSELQISLLAIGIIVVMAVYLYGYWQQRQYRRHFGNAFKQQREDALYHDSTLSRAPAADTSDRLAGSETARTNAADEPCSLLDERTDYIAGIYPKKLCSADVLALLWQRRFDFGKSVNACGQNAATGNWEKVIADSPLTYSAFRIGVQLANRSGAVTEARLYSFSELARDIGQRLQAETELPDIGAALQRAQALDAFCAEVDQMIGLNLLPGGGRALPGNDVARVAELHGLELQADGAFHLLDGRGHTVFSLSNYDNVPFQHHTLKQMRVNGLTLLLDVPRVEQPAQRFDQLVTLARALAGDLRAEVVDDHRVPVQPAALTQIRARVAEIEERMLEGNIIPGSAQARRLFA